MINQNIYHQKLFLIYVYEFFEENKVKMFYEILKPTMDFAWDFRSHTLEENQKYLLRWKRMNNIRLCDFSNKPRILDNGMVVYIERISGNYKNLIFEGEDRRCE